LFNIAYSDGFETSGVRNIKNNGSYPLFHLVAVAQRSPGKKEGNPVIL
jgi:hypothetical protein